MYESFYGLSASPFQLNPDPAFYFGSRGHSSAYSYLKFGVYQGEGFIVVTGEIGAGKTTLVRTLLSELDSNEVVAAQLVSTQLDGNDLLRSVAAAFGLPVKSATKAELLSTIEAFLTLLVTRSRRALLVVDEAQNLSPEALEELRMLSNFQLGSKPLLQSFLIGQPELRDMLRAPSMEQLRQRVLASYHLGPMDETETRAYIEHRLHKVGWRGDPMIDEAVYPLIYSHTRGLPRKINLLCNRMLLSAFLAERHQIGAADTLAVIEELRGEIGGGGITPAIETTPPPVSRVTQTTPAAARSEGAVRKERTTATTPRVSSTTRTTPRVADVVPIEKRAAIPKPLAVHEAQQGEANDHLPRRQRAKRALPKPEGEIGPIVCVVGTRSEVIKIAPLVRAIDARPDLPNAMLVHTGQHSEYAMSEQLFADLDLHVPDYDLEVGDVLGATQFGDIMRRFEPALDELRPSLVVVVGGSESALACGLVAAKRAIPLAHLEAGLRSFDRRSAGELNRELLDRAATLLYTTEHDAGGNLAREGIPSDRVMFGGSPTIDALLHARAHAMAPDEVLRSAGVEPTALLNARGYGVITLHSPAIIDNRETLAGAIKAVCAASALLPFVWPMHPRTRARIDQFGLRDALGEGRLAVVAPQGYLEMVGLLGGAAVVLTDSGGIQEECTVLSVPCMSLRGTTERPITVEVGSNTLVGLDQEALQRAVKVALDGHGKKGRIPEHWDGHACERIAGHLANWLARRQAKGARANEAALNPLRSNRR